MTLELATGPVSWGVDFAGAETNPPWTQVLDGAVAAGYGGIELGPLGFLPEEPARLRAALDERGLALVAGFVFEPLHRPDRRAEIVEHATRVSRLVAGVGGRHLVLIDLVSPERARSAGRGDDARRLTDAERRDLVDTVRALAAVGHAHGLTTVVHPHAGTFVEFEDEIEAVAEVAALCLDTGHLAYAGLDPVATYRRLAERVDLLHLKDVDRLVLDRVRAGQLNFWEAIAAGVFCPVGQGVVDFSALASALEEERHEGWATVEQDRLPGGAPVEDLIESRRVLRSLGVAS